MHVNPLRIALLGLLLALLASPAGAEPPDGELGYYREPALHGDTLVFVAEGDLWRVPARGGTAVRLTTHPAHEAGPVIAPDGRTIAFTARYEGPREVYTMPLGGGRPVRQTWGLRRPSVAGFAPDGRLAYASWRDGGLPDVRLALKDPASGAETRVPLAQADQAAWSADGRTLYFTRLPWQGSHCKRYRGGFVQQLWRFRMDGGAEAEPLTADHPGTSKNPMVWQGRLYFLSDRDGTMNVWSMDPEAADRDLRQETHAAPLDIRSASLDAGRIAYRRGADIRLLDLASGEDVVVPIRLATDADHTRTQWVEDPYEHLSAAHVAPDGRRVVLTTRGRAFVAPVGPGRRVALTRNAPERVRDARFAADGEDLLYFSDRSDEVELWSRPADGTGAPVQRTAGGTILRTALLPSPDGAFVAHQDKLARLWLLDTKTNADRAVEPVGAERLGDMAWSADGRWLVYTVYPATRGDHGVLRLFDTRTGTRTDLTSDRYDSRSPTFGRGGKWLYFLSDRHFDSLQRSPWGARAPGPYFDRPTRVYALALQPGLRSPFQEPDELHAAAAARKAEADKAEADEAKEDGKGAADQGKDAGAGKDAPEPVEIELAGLPERLHLVPVPPGNHEALHATAKHLLWLTVADPHAKSKHGGGARRDLQMLAISDADPNEVATRLEDVTAIELAQDAKHLLVRRGKAFHVLPADVTAKPDDKALAKGAVRLQGWTFPVDPRAEWRQMYADAWRLHRDYFYDAGMHGVDWPAMRARYAPLVERVRDRNELEDVTGMLISELSALHANVYGGQLRQAPDQVDVGFLGARTVRDEAAGGYRIEHVLRSDPEDPTLRSPLARLDLDIRVGDVIVAVNGRPTAPARELGSLLVDQVGRQVRLALVRPSEEGRAFDAIVTPISQRRESQLRYHEWEYTRRLEVERLGAGRLGYVHLRAMGAGDMAQFVREFYPVFDREGVIIDVRHNRGGNIDSWVLARLMRKIWMYWTGRTGAPNPSMQYAPRGHMIVLCDQMTASDGEAFAEGFRRLGLGPVLGMRTWGGEIWLSDANRLADGGIARAGMWGVYGPARDGDGQVWLIEGHGVEPDIVVDNPPHETFRGRDRQLEAAAAHLLERLAREPVPIPQPPPRPDKSVEDNRAR